VACERGGSEIEITSGLKVGEGEGLTEMAYLLREELGDSLSEGTPTSDLKRAIITIRRAAGYAETEGLLP
jgi:hypothetical protein